MRINSHFLRRRSSGQALIESAILIPFLLTVIFNAVNFGYLYYVALNMSAATRSGALYAIIGSNTPVNTSAAFSGGNGYAPAGDDTNCATITVAGKATTLPCTVRYIVYQDMTGALPKATTNATLKVCSQSLGITTTSGVAYANCQTFANPTNAGVSAPHAQADPETAATPSLPFMLHEVDIDYTFKPLVPSTVFGAAVLLTPMCTSGAGGINCVFHRKIYMRAM